ncbi:MAG: hypothetical protein FJX77_18060 [Armatimonadetes bacterium]|nr:hypothetical protein [Armatimonadota bacterium]
MYAQDYDERMPQLYNAAAVRLSINELILPYIKNWEVHNCPSADQKTTTGFLGSRSYGYHTGSFGLTPMFNWSTGISIALAEISRPAEIVMLGDVMQDRNAPGRFSPPTAGPMLTDYDGSNCRVDGRRHNSMFQDPLTPGNSGPRGHDWNPRPGFNFIERHSGFANVGFADGHVKAMKHLTLYNRGQNLPYFDFTR